MKEKEKYEDNTKENDKENAKDNDEWRMRRGDETELCISMVYMYGVLCGVLEQCIREEHRGA